MTKVPHRDIIMNCWIGIMVDYTTKIFHKGSFESRHRENLPVLRHDTEQGQSDVKNPKFGILMRCRGFDTNGKCVLAEKRAEQMVQTSRPAKSFQWARNIIPMGTERKATSRVRRSCPQLRWVVCVLGGGERLRLLGGPGPKRRGRAPPSVIHCGRARGKNKN